MQKRLCERSKFSFKPIHLIENIHKYILYVGIRMVRISYALYFDKFDEKLYSEQIIESIQF